MPHKRNPARPCSPAPAPARRSRRPRCSRREHEHERAAGAWQAEWEALSDALALTGGALAAARESLEGLEVDTARMRANMSAELASEQRAFGIEGDYLGAAPAFVDRVLEAWRDTTDEGREG